MKLIIDLPDKTIAHIRSDYGHKYFGCIYDDDKKIIMKAIYNGTPLPKNHGDLIDKDEFLLNLGNEHIGGIEAIKDYTGEDTWTDGLHTAWRVIDDMSAIIEADIGE